MTATRIHSMFKYSLKSGLEIGGKHKEQKQHDFNDSPFIDDLGKAVDRRVVQVIDDKVVLSLLAVQFWMNFI
jgi:hypothetical protein